MSLTFLSVNNQATVLTTTVNSNTVITLTSSSTMTSTVLSAASGLVSINPALAISVAVTAQDLNFETRLDAMITIFTLASNLGKFTSKNNPLGKSRGENDRRNMNEFSANASLSEIYQLSDDESNCGPPPQKKTQQECCKYL